MIFQTSRLLVRDPDLADWTGVHTFLSDPRVMRWIHLGPDPYTAEQTQAWIREIMVHNQTVPRTSHNSVILEIETGSAIGWIGIGKPSHPEYGDLDFGYALRQDRWGLGYMTEVVMGLLDFAFSSLNGSVVYAECETANIGSYRVMEKAGMTRIETFNAFYEPHEQPLEVYRYAISRESWTRARTAP